MLSNTKTTLETSTKATGVATRPNTEGEEVVTSHPEVGMENNNNQNFWAQPTDKLSPRLCNVPRRYNKIGKDNNKVPVEQKMGWQMP